jgi:hypothetical protein
VVVMALALLFVTADYFSDKNLRNNLVRGLAILGMVLWFGLYVLCQEAIFRFNRARKDFLCIVETHGHLMNLASDEQVLANLASTPEEVLDMLVKNLTPRRSEIMIRKANARITLLENWLEANPESDKSEDGELWLEFNYELSSLRHLKDCLIRNM